jgi:hypothetical protein
LVKPFGGYVILTDWSEKMKIIIARIVLAIALAAAAVAGPNLAMASTDRITEGEARAVLNSLITGGTAIVFNGDGRLLGAPADANLAIRPYQPNGLHYCVEDWHLLALIWFDATTSFEQAQLELNAVQQTFYIDGVALQTERTPVKPVVNSEDVPFLTDDEDWYWFQEGVLLSPSDLTVGSHTLTVVTVDTYLNTKTTQKVKFYVDAAGTGACI